MKRNVSIKTVAQEAGVSIASVSNFLNNKKGKYTEETGRKIMEAIKKLDYQVDIHARVLAKGHSNLIGLVLPITYSSSTSITLLKNNPFYSELYDGIAHEAFTKNYDIIISGFKKADDCISWIKQRKLDGVIIVGMPFSFVEEILKSITIPIALVDNLEKKTGNCYNIKSDEEQAFSISIQYLIDCGHKNIALATGFISGSNIYKVRSNGYYETLKNNHIKINKDYCFQDYTSFDGGYRIGEKILENKNEVTAVAASSDIMALGLIRCFYDHQIKVPDDISIIGFDDLKIASYINPTLTTIRQHIEKKGILAAKNIIHKIDFKDTLGQTIIIPSELIVRETVKKI
ncbi:MAG: LacI family transcriptional regulator [Spirochaetes bacterium]|nr:LacI family transcriptional regulator [Spirochaetota bacterium]